MVLIAFTTETPGFSTAALKADLAKCGVLEDSSGKAYPAIGSGGGDAGLLCFFNVASSVGDATWRVPEHAATKVSLADLPEK
jgi:hypothetical protein